ncbi:chemotaxis protein CheW [Aquabacterium fontiphilum]|jgi:purine-binding chemotaxis protein CheW|uniref:chemotaxis protein CheW n=1 Tax=Aquabacterium fontiphilum TaxID=450365 RepID=UPI001F016FA9|nr:chemotaxis protein CheW [Aquabacterium fontiphilum]
MSTMVATSPALQGHVSPDDGTSGMAPRQHLCLTVARDTYAVPIDAVREILEVGRLTPLPLTPDFVTGVMNLRGAVVPVIDLQARCFGQVATIARRSSIVIVEVARGDPDGALVVGVLVDGVSEVLEIADDDIDPPPLLGTRIAREFLAGMAKVRDTLVPVLDLDRVLSREALASLMAAHLTH